MRVFALSDPHLSFGTPDKLMDRFGPQWVNHPGKMAAAWDERVSDDDLVLVPGDISWARKLQDAARDLAWIGARADEDVGAFLPLLTRILDLKRQEAMALAAGGTAYDALLDEYEPGATGASLEIYRLPRPATAVRS